MNKFELVQNKIRTQKQLLTKVAEWRSSDQRVVFTNGVFDLLHRGHIAYLAQAADFGDKFIVAVNADVSVKKIRKRR
jgi:cytidyltransferase-like protein